MTSQDFSDVFWYSGLQALFVAVCRTSVNLLCKKSRQSISLLWYLNCFLSNHSVGCCSISVSCLSQIRREKFRFASNINREVPPDVIFGLYELTLRLWKNGANSAVKCIRRLRLWACTHVEYGWVASGPWMASVLQISPAGDVVFVFVFVLSVFQSRNRKSTCKNTAHPHVFVFVVCRSRNLSNVSRIMFVVLFWATAVISMPRLANFSPCDPLHFLFLFCPLFVLAACWRANFVRMVIGNYWERNRERWISSKVGFQT